jgi:Zn-dependent M16 (insulinase) family peptidase
MEALRVLSVDTIRDYHQSYYVPQNLCLIVAGRLSTESLLEVLQKQVEPTIVKHGQGHGPRPKNWKRPFVETPSVKPPVLNGKKTEDVEFPEKDESMGELSLFYVGPSPEDHLLMKVRIYRILDRLLTSRRPSIYLEYTLRIPQRLH